MITREKSSVYNIIQTPLTEIDLKGGECIYSVLALYRDDDVITSRFVYDIARSEKDAVYIIEKLQHIKPRADEICETISELL